MPRCLPWQNLTKNHSRFTAVGDETNSHTHIPTYNRAPGATVAIVTTGELLAPLCCLFLALPVDAVFVPQAGSAVPAMSQPFGGSTAGNGLIAPSGQPVGSLAPPSRPPWRACACMHARGANCGCSGRMRMCD